MNSVLLLNAAFLLGSGPISEQPPSVDYCQRLEQPILGRKHGFLAGNVTYYVGGFHASWNLIEHETLGLTHPFHHDLRSRGVGLLPSEREGENDTGTGNDFSGWEFYKDTRVLYGSVVVDGKVHRHPVPKRMYWRPDRMVCEYEVAGVRIREDKFIAANDAACAIITSSKPLTLQFEGHSFFGRHSVTSTATIEYDEKFNAIQIVEGGTTRSKPETDRSDHVGPIMYQGMSTVLTSSRSFAANLKLSKGEHNEQKYEFQVPCDASGVAVVWAMHDDYKQATKNATSLIRRDTDTRSAASDHAQPRQSEAIMSARKHLAAKTEAVNQQLNLNVPYFRCSDRKFEDIYYYLWSLYLMYYIDVQSGMELEPHTQTAVNNFLGMHRYDATFQIRVGSWTTNKRRYAYGNVLTWKHLFENGYYRKSPNGVISLSDNKGKTWHSGVYGNELSEHVLGAWQIYQHTGDVEFVRECYEGYFRDVFYDAISPFFSNHFEVAEVLVEMAKITDHEEDVSHWRQLVPLEARRVRNWFDQRWQNNGHENFFGGAKDGKLMTTGFWHLRSKHFPREYADKMIHSWALNTIHGFLDPNEKRPFPLAMSQQSMKRFASRADKAFGYTPDTAYFTLSGMFRQKLKPASRLTVQHLKTYNWHDFWNIPVAPEAYRRDGSLFGDQYSNFNAGKLLLYLEGLAGLEVSIPQRQIVIRPAKPESWDWMEFRLPIEGQWIRIRYEDDDVQVSPGPLEVKVERQ